jgi:hypothetical protein
MSDKPTTISSMEDFKRQFGDRPAIPPFDPVERARLLGLENIPERWCWLSDHPRLLSIAYFLRPSWQPDIAHVCRVVAAEGAEVMEKADVVSSEIWAEFERRFPGWRSEE